jgi:hypothetical protein
VTLGNSGTNLKIYMKKLKETFIDLTLYVVDIILFINDPKGLLLSTKGHLKTKFNMIDMNVLPYYHR